MMLVKIVFLLIGLAVILFCLMCIFPVIKIQGDSMYPTLKEGEKVIGCRLFNKRNCKEGKVYVIHLRNEDNGEPYFIIKRLYRIYFYRGEYKYYFLGDNRNVSADSRHYGLFDSSQVVAVIIGKKGKRQ